MKTPEWAIPLGLLILNLFQSAFTQLTGDESLYWMYWNNMSLGFRDHPPTIGVIIGLGYSLLKSELGVRLFVAIANSISIWLIYRLVQPKNWWQFLLIVLSIPAMNMYGFIATPDVPLMLSAALYLTAWKRFIDTTSAKNTFFLGVCMALLAWSKYHGIFVILFTLLPLKRMWFNARFWLAALVGVCFYSPHIYWQIVQDLPTVKFHLNERNSDAWEIKHILGFLGGQLLVFNPVILISTFVVIWKNKSLNDYEKSLRWFFIGLVGLFFLDSFRGRVEPHWTAPLIICVMVILFNHLNSIKRIGLFNAGIGFFVATLIFVRVALVFDIVPQLHREFHRDKDKMMALHEIAGDLPVCFMNSYQNPSLYMFYTGGFAHSLNNVDGGKNQFDYWKYNEYCNQKPFLFVSSYDAPGFEKIEKNGFSFHTKEFTDLPFMHGLTIRTDEWLHHMKAGQIAEIPARITNGNSYNLQLKNGPHTIRWLALFNHKKKNEAIPELEIKGMPDQLSSRESAEIVLKFVVPDLTGRNYLLFASRVDELPATYQSNKLRVMIEK